MNINSIDRPSRATVADDKARLLALDAASEPSTSYPSTLKLSELVTLPSLFQPRETSLVLREAHSRKHIETLAQVVKEKGELDPVAVVAFGDKWFLIDGHHRCAAYRLAGRRFVPVLVQASPLRGAKRLTWASRLSVNLNHKDKLPMSVQDKLDAAWRLVVLGGSTKEQVHVTTGVSTSSISSMRRVLARLIEGGQLNEDACFDCTWSLARYHYSCLDGALDLEDPEARTRRLRILSKKMSPLFAIKFSLIDFLEVAEGLRPGFQFELKDLLALDV